MDPLMTSDEVAEVLRISVRTLAYWRYQAIGPRHITVGKYVRYEQKAVLAYIANPGGYNAGRLADVA